jgi:hypothetical protein
MSGSAERYAADVMGLVSADGAELSRMIRRFRSTVRPGVAGTDRATV